MKTIITSLVVICLVTSFTTIYAQKPVLNKTGDNPVKTQAVTTRIDNTITEEMTVTVKTMEVKYITPTGATCSFTVNSKSTVTEQGVCVGKGTAPTPDNNRYFPKNITGPSFSAEISGLAPASKYYVRAYAKNSLGTIYYGNELSFTTLNTK